MLIAAVGLAVVSQLSAQQSSDSDDWFPWAYSVDLHDPIVNESISAEQGFDKLKSIELWSSDGERLVLQLIASDVFDETVELFAKHAAKKAEDADVVARLGMLLTFSAYSAESEAEITRLSTEADRLFDQAVGLDENNWDAWIGKATLYGFTEVSSYEEAAIRILNPLVDAQEEDRVRKKYAYSYLILGELQKRQGDLETAKATWRRGLEQLPNNEVLKEKLGNDK